MKSPFTGGKVELKEKLSTIIYKGKQIEYIMSYYECQDTYETFTTTEMDNFNMYKIITAYNLFNNC